MGAIDIKQAMPGSLADVEAEVERRIQTLAPGGGYILAPSNHLQVDVPPENIVALYEFGRRHGGYPIGRWHEGYGAPSAAAMRVWEQNLD